MLKRLPAVFTAMLLTIATFAFAAELRDDHPSTYTVRKGDTLWDISARFLKKPWLWPEIWQANPQVKNPHRIYPGDVLSLVYINGQPMLTGPEVHTGDAIETIPLSQIEAYLKQLTVVDDVKSLPYVVGIEEDQLAATAGQLVYVRGLVGAQPGQQYQLARPMLVYGLGKPRQGRRIGGFTSLDYRGMRDHIHWSPSSSPTEAHGERLGYELMMQSAGEVTQVQGEIALVMLKGEGMDVRVGDRVLPLAPPYDAQFYPQPPSSVTGAQVLAVADGLHGAGPNSVLALSAGLREGVKNGTVFSIWNEGVMRPDSIKHGNPLAAEHDKVAMPDQYIGHVMVFLTFDKVSYGLVMDAIRPARVGDLLKHPDATQ